MNDISKVEKLLVLELEKIVHEKEYVCFLVGRNGDFDQCAASSVRRIRKRYGEAASDLMLVLPYPTAEYMNNQKGFEDYYSDIEISDLSSAAHPKAAIQMRNREMVDRADVIICCVEHPTGGAYKAAEYAAKMGKKIVNLADVQSKE